MSAVDCRVYGGPYLIACRCGQALRSQDMHRVTPPRRSVKDSLVIHRISCLPCALRAVKW